MTTEENPDDQPQPEQNDDSPEQPGQPSASRPEEQLQAIIEGAKTVRLAPADEDRAVQLLKQTVMGGPKALPVTLDAILTLPWSAGVKAVTEAWPETKPAGRTRLLTGLAKQDSDVSRRIRLSLARGLHAQDAAAALKLLTSVCEAMGGAQGGSSTKDRQIFANVMLGKARPWIMNVSMADMKLADAQKIIIPALESCAQAPIFTQIWVLRWICDAEKFDVLSAEHVESIGKAINRWQSRWHKELRKIIPKLPDSLEAAMAKSPGGPPVSAPATDSAIASASAAVEAAAMMSEAEPGEEMPVPSESEAEEIRASEPRPPASPAPSREPQQRLPRERDRDRDRDRDRGDRDRDRDRAPLGGPFDLNRSLREIESYVARLRSELQQAQVAARRREPASDRHRGRSGSGPAASPEEMEELRRHNHQLEEQNQELRHRIEELTSDHEDRAATLEISDSLEQFKTFLGLKLKEDFADYNAISRESLNEVVRRHAHEILGRIFTLLQAEGVRFDKEE